jgi:hypothetical protein
LDLHNANLKRRRSRLSVALQLTLFSLPGRQQVETPGRAAIFLMQQFYHLADHERYWPVSRRFLTLGPDPLPAGGRRAGAPS